MFRRTGVSVDAQYNIKKRTIVGMHTIVLIARRGLSTTSGKEAVCPFSLLVDPSARWPNKLRSRSDNPCADDPQQQHQNHAHCKGVEDQ